MFSVKKIFLILLLILSIKSFSIADEISDFQIEEISIGESLLNHINKQLIQQKKNSYSDNGYIYNSKDYYSLTFSKNLDMKNYDQIQIHLKDKDESYIIKSISGIKLFRNDYDGCIPLLKTIEQELDNLLSSAEKETASSTLSKLDKSKGYWYLYPDGSNVYIGCEDWSVKSKIPDCLAVVVNSSKFQKFIDNKAYN
jgi:hypothetical protein